MPLKTVPKYDRSKAILPQSVNLTQSDGAIGGWFFIHRYQEDGIVSSNYINNHNYHTQLFMLTPASR